MQGFYTPQQPNYPSITPTQRIQTSSDTLRSNYYANIQAAESQGGSQGMHPPSQTSHSPMVSPTYDGQQGMHSQMPGNSSFGSMQMQTPPPTRGTTNRKAQYPQEIAFGTPSTIASRRYMTPQQPAAPMSNEWLGQQTPIAFPQLQFSPDMYQFANLGPASAPVMPQSRVFWDQSSPLQAVPQRTLDDPFAPMQSIDMELSTAQLQKNGSQDVPFGTPAMSSFSVQPAQEKTLPARRMSANVTMPINKEQLSTGVDPSLLYSGPVRPAVRFNDKADNVPSVASRQNTRQKESALQAHTRSETLSSTDTVINRSRSNLQRSKTTASGSMKNAVAFRDGTESLSRSNSVNQLTRTASPVKRIGRPTLGSLSEGRPRQRTSVILTVDEHGIARTQTKRVDSSPTRSARERYPGLFDSDSSDAESNASEAIPSRPSSFIFDKRDERKSKAARLDPPVENLEGLTIPRSGSSASMRKGIAPSRAVVAATAQLRRQGSLRRSTPSRNSRRLPSSSSTTSLIDTCPMEVSASHDQSLSEAQQASNASLHPNYGVDYNHDAYPTDAGSTLDDHNRRWSMMSFEQQQQRPMFTSPPHQQYHPVFNTSPTMPPPPSRSHLQIRCQCGYSDDAGLPLVQCRSCTQYCHATCVGLDGDTTSSTFTCFLCTKPPSRSSSGR